MTEDEAKSKWCPFSRVAADLQQEGTVIGVSPAFNRRTTAECPRGSTVYGSLCIGSACMAWRPGTLTENGERVYPPEGHGYCGLAGKP